MSIEMFLLFLATLLFGGFNLYTNIKAGDKFLKLLTLVAVYVSIAGSLILLTIVFVRVVAG